MVTGEPDSTTGNTRWTNTQWRLALSYAQGWVASEVCAVKKETTYTLVNEKVSYKLPYKCIGIEAVWFVTDVDYNRVDYQQARDFPSAKEPGSNELAKDDSKLTEPAKRDYIVEWTATDDSLKIGPKLGYAKNKKIRVVYCKYPAKLDSLAQVSELSEWYDMATVKLAEWILENPNLTIAEEQAVLANGETIVQAMIRQYARRPADLKAVVK